MFEGAVGMAKNSKSVAEIKESLEMIVEFLDTLAPVAGRAA
jgi:hypothetical protein